jgi:hypothetical protein
MKFLVILINIVKITCIRENHRKMEAPRRETKRLNRAAERQMLVGKAIAGKYSMRRRTGTMVARSQKVTTNPGREFETSHF